jgi:hypothetical protein
MFSMQLHRLKSGKGNIAVQEAAGLALTQVQHPGSSITTA